MTDDLAKKLQQLQAFANGMQAGFDKTVAALPLITEQQIFTKAKKKLNSTLDTYMDAVQVNIEDYVLVVELDGDNWLANALEKGKSSFDMKEGLLNSPKAKTNKLGKKYIRVPMQKDKNRSPDSMGTEKGQEYQRLIQQVMNKPKFGNSTLKHGSDGKVIESQRIITDEPKLQGFYRVRKLDSAKQFYERKTQGIPFQYLMFRTVSEMPSKTGAEWEHPGLNAVNIFREMESELPQIFETLLDQNIQAELEGIF